MNRSRSASLVALMIMLAVPLLGQAAPKTAPPKSAPEKTPAREPWQRIPTPPLPPFHPQEPVRIELKNGMVIFLQEDHELPLIDGTLRIRGGGREIPDAKTGMMDIYGEAWRTGGTKTKTGDQLDDFLEARAAKVETGAGVDSTSIGFSCLKQDFDDVFAVFLDVLRNPEFRQDKIDLAKREIDTGISRRNDEIGDIAGRESAKLAWGAENPYARQAEYATVAAVTRQDLIDFHTKYLHPNNVILGIVGDFDPKQMEARLRKEFEGWERGPAFKETPVDFRGAKPGVYFVEKGDVNQSAIRMVYPVDVTRRSPDFYAIEVMNEVLGGGFASRLVANVRSKQGLAYAVGGGISVPFSHPGMMRLAMGTKSQTTVEGSEALKEQMASMIQHPATETELRRAKDDILNAFIFHFDSKAKVMQERMTYEFYGYPADFLEKYRDGIEKVTAADVARVSEKYLHPSELAVLVVGNQAEFGKPLSTLGPVTELNIAIPPPPGEEKAEQGGTKMPAPKQSNLEGKQLAQKLLEGMGGAAAVDEVKAFRQTATMNISSAKGKTQLDYEMLVAFPERSRISMQTPMGAITMVLGPGGAFMESGDSVQVMSPPQHENVLNSLKRDFINVGQHVNDPKYIFAADGEEKIGEVEAKVLNVDLDGAVARWYVDPKTGHVLRAIFERNTPQGPVRSTNDFSDWRTVSGVTLPFARTVSEGGKEGGSAEIKEFVINPPVDPKLFEKPEPAGK